MTATSLDEIVEFVNGGAWKQTEYADEGSPVLQVSNISGDRFDITDHKWLNSTSSQKYAKNTLKAGDVIIATVGSHAQSDSAAGRAVVVDASVAGFLLNQNAVALRSKSEKLDQSYLGYLCKSRDFQIYAKSAGKGAANQMRIGVGALKSYEFDLPDLDDQVHISSILRAYDHLIENNRRRIALLEEAARQLYKEWFVRFRFPGHEHVPIVDGVPEGWEFRELTSIWSINYGKNLPTSKLTDNGKYPVHGANKVIGRYDEKNVDVSVCLVGCRGTVGVVRRTFGEAFVTNNSFVVHPHPINPSIKFHFTIFAMERLRLEGMRSGAAQPQLTLANLSHLCSVVPPSSLLDGYNETVDVLFAQADLLRQQIEMLTKARDLLLLKLMSGEITV